MGDEVIELPIDILGAILFIVKSLTIKSKRNE